PTAPNTCCPTPRAPSFAPIPSATLFRSSGLVMWCSSVLTAHVASARSITLQLQDAQVETVFEQIEKQSGMTFVYQPGDLTDVNRVSIEVKKGNLVHILTELEQKTPLEFKQIGNMIGVTRTSGESNRSKTMLTGEPTGKSTAEDHAAMTVSGTVTDQNEDPLIGVNVTVEGTNKGTTTDYEGHFNLDDIEEDAVLIISYIGYKTQRLPINGQSTLTIILEEDMQTLDEVVVIGYGTQKKSSLTGSIAKIENTTLDQMPSGRLENALAGKLAGVSIVNNRNTPG